MLSDVGSYAVVGNGAGFTRDFEAWFPRPFDNDDWTASATQSEAWTPAIIQPDSWTTE